MIKKIKISNYRHFDNIEIDFQAKSRIIENRVGLDTTIKIGNHKILKQIGIIGANSSGKTTIIKAIELITNILNVEDLGANKFFSKIDGVIWGKEFEKRLHIREKNPKSKESSLWKDMEYLSERPKNFEFLSDIDILWKNEIFARLAFDYNKSILFEIEIINNDGLETKIVGELNHNSPNGKIVINSENYTINYSKDIYIGKDNKGMSKIDKKRSLKLRDIAFPNIGIWSNFNNNRLYRSIPLNKEYEADFLKWMKLADPNIKQLITTDSGNHYIVENFLTTSNKTKSFSHLSFGTKIWLNWFFLIKENQFILFDEIDSSLHIKLIRYFLRKMAENNIQVIFTTHNPLVFGKTFRNDSIYFIDYNNNKLERLIESKKIDKDKSIQKMILDEEIGIHPDLSIIYDELV